MKKTNFREGKYCLSSTPDQNSLNECEENKKKLLMLEIYCLSFPMRLKVMIKF